ncbi:uncharacterized protein LOC134780813 [Penaeus indicus]|uniref:uncharacterized protein LOC134780813 n=1 Tax=Penaeus indicus TaxID=29960 RepID=UPI00300C710B
MRTSPGNLETSSSLTTSTTNMTSTTTSSSAHATQGESNAPKKLFTRQNSRTDTEGFVLSPVRDRDGSLMVGVKGIVYKIKKFESEYKLTTVVDRL